eukprot:6415219-Pyramimonas_sp.AAC.1
MAATARPSATSTPPGGPCRPRKSLARMRVPEGEEPAAVPRAEVKMLFHLWRAHQADARPSSSASRNLRSWHKTA